MTDLLAIFDTLPNKKHLWHMMRYMCLVYEYQYNIQIEIHTPRNSKEIFTYYSDKYWAKLIYGLTNTNKNVTMLNRIYKGSETNLIYHWYQIIKDNNYLIRDNIYYDVTYYINYNHIIEEKEKVRHEKLTEENKILSRILSYIVNILAVRKDNCEYLLRYFCNHETINDNLINKFYEYLTSSVSDSCIEREKKENIFILLNYIVD